FTTKEEGKGRGLGLAVVYAIVQEHGGKIIARNREGGGAELVVTLPAAPNRA
ncbi:MAG TPA: ATP-binding protein, partial [Polyangia bacterium]